MEEERLSLDALSPETLAALQSVLAERAAGVEAAAADPFGVEDWALSQFHYTDETARRVAGEVARVCGAGGRVACVSCPTLFAALQDHQPSVQPHLFEYDEKYASRGSFSLYDYNEPTRVETSLHGVFAVVCADPPYLAEECLSKTAVTIRLLGKPGAARVLLTGAVMQAVARRELGVRPVTYRPQHANKLGNEFKCYTSHDDAGELGSWEPDDDLPDERPSCAEHYRISS